MLIDSENNLILAGYFAHNSGFKIGQTELQGYGSDDGFIAKLNSDFDLLWVKTMGGDYLDRVFNVFVNDLGDIFIGGGFDSYTNFHYDNAVIIPERMPNSLSMFQLKIKGNGEFEEAMAFFGANPGTSLSNNKTVVLNDGRTFTAGRIIGEAEFIEGGEVFDSEGHASGFVMKWDEIFPILETDDFSKTLFAVYPNPTRDYVTINGQNHEDFTINLYDISGKKLFSTPGSDLIQISLEGFDSGVCIF